MYDEDICIIVGLILQGGSEECLYSFFDRDTNKKRHSVSNEARMSLICLRAIFQEIH